MEKTYLAALLMVPGIGQERLKTLIRFFGSAQQAWQASRRDLFLCGCISENVCNSLIQFREKTDIEKTIETWAAQGIFLCAIGDPDYPVRLSNIFNPPAVLYYRGVLPKTDNTIAIVGTRKASAYGKNAARSLAAELADAGFWVTSGAARGIDTAAHQGALTKGKTLAVLGCGVNVSYPPENANLLAQIVASGAVLSEYPPGTPPHAGFFPARNRIISGLSRGVVVIEAGEKSGSLITSDFALEEGRDVFAVPGSIFSELNKGTHRLIKQGAKLVDSVTDILEEYQIERVRSVAQEPVNLEEKLVYGVLTYDNPMSMEEIVLRSKLPAATVSYTLLQLELREMVLANGQCYVRNAREGIR